MTDLTLSLLMFSSMIALVITYTLIMTLLKKEPAMRMFRVEALGALVFVAISLGLSFSVFTGDATGAYLLFSAMLLALGFLLSLALVLYNRFKIRNASVLTAEQHTMVRSFAIINFTLILLHFLALLAGIAGF